MPIATPPSSITERPFWARNCCPQVVPSSSAEAMKQVFSTTGWPSMPPSAALSYLTASCAPSVASAPITIGPPCWFTRPMYTGALAGFALPALPSTYFRKFVTE
jgi:hypothetical protein